MPRKTTPAIERLNSKLVEVPAPEGSCLTTPCLIFQGKAEADAGHGLIKVDGKMKRTHREAWEEVHGPIPEGQAILHLCDTPKCCNVDHMRLGTQAENNQDCNAKGRRPSVSPLTMLNKSHALQEDGSDLWEIAKALNTHKYEIERLLDFWKEDESTYQGEKALYGEEEATERQCKRLVDDYAVITGGYEIINLARHIKQLELSV